MSKLLLAFIAFSTVSVAVGEMLLAESRDFVGNFPKIKQLSDPSIKGAYPGDDTDYEKLLSALAQIQEPISVDKVKAVLKENATKLYKRVEAAEAAYAQVRDSIGDASAKNFVTQIGVLIEKYYLVGLHINEQAKQGEQVAKLYNALNKEGQVVVAEKLKAAFEAVEKALYKP